MKELGILAGVFLLFFLSDRWTYRTQKRPGISVGVGVSNILLKITALGYVGMVLWNRKYLSLTWAGLMIGLTFLVSFLFAWVWVKKTRVQLRMKQDVAPDAYVIEGCETLVLIADAMDFLFRPNLRGTWFQFLKQEGKTYARELQFTRAILGKYDFMPVQRYVTLRGECGSYQERFLFFRCGNYPTWVWNRVKPYLHQKEKEGFQILLYGAEKEDFLYAQWPVWCKEKQELPFEQMKEYELWKELKQYYLRMKKFEGTQSLVQKLCTSETLDGQFYLLLEKARDTQKWKDFDWLHRGSYQKESEEILSLAETVLQLLEEGKELSKELPAEKLEMEIATCPADVEYVSLGLEWHPDTEEAVIHKKAEFYRNYKHSAVWSIYGKEEIFQGWCKGLNGKYMTRSRFEKEYAEQILQEEACPERYHDVLMKLETERVVNLIDGVTWDGMQTSWFSNIRIEEAYISNLMMEGEFLPIAPVHIAFLRKQYHEMQYLFPWIKGLTIKEFAEPEDVIDWTRHNSIETEVYSERIRLYRKALKNMECESIFINSNVYLAGLYKNAFDRPDKMLSICGMLDFVEFALRSVQGLLLELELDSTKEISEPDFLSMGSYILEHAKEGTVLYNRTHFGKLMIVERCRRLHQEWKKYSGCEVKGEEMDFESLIHLLHQIREYTKCTCQLDSEQIKVLWELMLYYTIMLNRFLDLYHFGMRVENTRIWAGYIEGYEGGYVRARTYFTVDQDVPCPVWRIQDKEKTYINYFYGAQKVQVKESLVKEEPEE